MKITSIFIRTIAGIVAWCCLIPQVTKAQMNAEKQVNPVILYSGNPKSYEIGGIAVSGVKNYEDYVLIGLSGLSVGQKVQIPGDDITNATKRYWKHGLFSDVRILADSIVGDRIYLTIQLAERPRISEIHYNGVKKSEREDLESRLGIVKGRQITPNMVDRAKIVIKRYFDEKGFKNAEVEIVQRDDVAADNQMIVDINIDKKEKIKINKIYINGNEHLSDKTIRKAMKKTRERSNWANRFRNFFKGGKKFITEKYEEDKDLIIEKYNELGYRDAQILSDSVVAHDDRTVDIYLNMEEGNRYYLRHVTWVGNTVYPADKLNEALQMKRGDVYNQKKMSERLNSDEDAIQSQYYNNGYVFLELEPVEVNVDGDSIDVEMRMREGRQATINRVRIAGNDRLYEDVVRRELRTKPGDLFSKAALERSYRDIAQMGHFNPETINPDIKPDRETGTVDINWMLESKANDQIELSAGWGQTGVIGRVSLKFTNFSMANLFKKSENRRGFLPQGDGQTLTLSGQTNGDYYQSYSISFFDPWFGGKRPNSFSVSAFYSKQTDVSSNYYNSAYYNNYYNYLYGYGNYNSSYYNSYESFYDPDKSVQMYGVSVMFGKRLRWPDDYFTFTASLSYQRYVLKDWQYFPVTNGKSNNISLELTLSRNSVDNPIFPRSGAEFTLSCQLTPPYSLWDGVDYSKYAQKATDANYQRDMNQKYKWVEYHKWKFKSKTYTALMDINKTPVLMTRVEFGLLGHYNRYKRSPFETFYMGGDGMSGYSYSYATETIALRGYENGSLTPYGYEGYAYSRLGLELRYPLMLEGSTNIYALAFVEGGNAWSDVKDFNPFDMKRSAGAGVRIFLPMVGLMGIDWAYGFDKVYGSSQYGGSQFHFILGQEF
ncbi:MAG: outer membrane protein assembly factor BamA [Bacteroidaceae bacterium]|nr:outer membrane protein assembly factor BamA [Bacteroidaceae bacterium]